MVGAEKLLAVDHVTSYKSGRRHVRPPLARKVPER